MAVNRRVPVAHVSLFDLPMSIFKFKWHFSQKAQQQQEQHTHRLAAWLTDIRRDKLPIRAIDVHKTKRVSTTHSRWAWAWEVGKNIEKSKTSKIFVIAFENGRRGRRRGRRGVAGGGELPSRAEASPCMRLQCSACPFTSFCLLVVCLVLRPSSCLIFLFFCLSVSRFCSGNGN